MYRSRVQEKVDEDPQKDFVYRIVRDGYNIIPVSGKFPPCLPWKKYQTRQVTIDEICQWGKNRWPKKNGSGSWSAKILNYALPTGKKPYSDAPAVIVVDADDAEAEALVTSRCPETPVKQRTSRGLQRVYRRPPEDQIVYIPNRQKTNFGGKVYNLDIRGDGGYIMCPGSTHPVTHTLYQEEQPWSRELIDQAPVYDPAWIPDERQPAVVVRQNDDTDIAVFDAADFVLALEQVELPVAVREAQARVYLEGVPGSEEGTGANRSCASLTMRVLWGFGLPPNRTVAVLSEWERRDDHIDKAGYPYPWTTEEIRRKVEWCLRQKYHGEIGDKLHPVSGDLDAALVEEYFRSKAEENREEELREELESESDWGIPNKEWPAAGRTTWFACCLGRS